MSAPDKLTPEEIFRLYPALAARVTNLRAIIQTPSNITRENVDLWVDDVRSTMADFILLNERTAEYLREALGLSSQE